MTNLKQNRQATEKEDKHLSDDELHQKVDEWFKSADKDKNGILTLTEASLFIKQWILEEYEIEGGQSLIEDTFREIDKNGDNFITKEELFQHMKDGQDVFYDASDVQEPNADSAQVENLAPVAVPEEPIKSEESDDKKEESDDKPEELEDKPEEPETKPEELEDKPVEPETKPEELEDKPEEPETKQDEPETKQDEPETKQDEPETKQDEPEANQDEPATKQEETVARSGSFASSNSG